MTENIKKQNLEKLILAAREAGADEAVIVPTGEITVDPFLADRCREPKCRNYGLSKSCPPYVSGPAAFKKLLEEFDHAVFCKIDVPSEILDAPESYLSDESRAVFRLLHEITAGIERAAVNMGYVDAQAYAGGSCKHLFCHTQSECLVVSGKGKCRNPMDARPSMSGFGVDVAKLFKTCGWEMRWDYPGMESSPMKMAALSGLVLIC